jgi:hypothetical protein
MEPGRGAAEPGVSPKRRCLHSNKAARHRAVRGGFSGCQLTNCRRCSSRLEMNFFVLTVTVESDMLLKTC